MTDRDRLIRPTGGAPPRETLVCPMCGGQYRAHDDRDPHGCRWCGTPTDDGGTA